MDTMERLGRAGLIPVVVLDDPNDAVPAAKALLDGGIDVMEITFRTGAAAEAIGLVKQNCPDMLVGAGTVTTLEQCRQAVSLGAEFIVSPGFDEETVRWCVENRVTVTPGCATPTEIMRAHKLGLNVLKFFPANIYGGLSALKALSAPFPGVRFIPTGGVNAGNIGEFSASPFVFAVGGSWVCAKADIASHNFEKITALCREARKNMLGFAVAHIGINAQNAEDSAEVCWMLNQAFDLPVKLGNSSNFASDGVEVMKTPGLGAHGHIAIATNNMTAAVAELAARGFALAPESSKMKNGRMIAAYLKEQAGGFALHLLQR